jgi:hypothetical protein
MGETSYKGDPLTLLSLVATFKWIPYYLNCIAVLINFLDFEPRVYRYKVEYDDVNYLS